MIDIIRLTRGYAHGIIKGFSQLRSTTAGKDHCVTFDLLTIITYCDNNNSYQLFNALVNIIKEKIIIF